MRVFLVVALPGHQAVEALEVAAGTTLRDAIEASGIEHRHPALAGGIPGIWGRRRDPFAVLREDDRIEVYRPVRADAKAMRRARVDGTTRRTR